MKSYNLKFKKILTVTTALALISSTADALPTGGQVMSGQANITEGASSTTINQTSHAAQINWNTFGSSAGESINFKQPDSRAYTINRVTGGVPSILAGAMKANGRVVVMNEAGVTFAHGSQTNVGALVATTAKNITMDGTGNNPTFSNLSDAPIVNNGKITATIPGNGVAFQAANITNNGSIVANQRGIVALISNDNMSFDLGGTGKISYSPGAKLSQSIITSSDDSTIVTPGGSVIISNQQANDIAANVINLHGVIDVSTVGIPNFYSSNTPYGGSVDITANRNLDLSHSYIRTSGTGNSGDIGYGGDITLKAGNNIDLTRTRLEANGPVKSNPNNNGNINISAPNLNIVGGEHIIAGSVAASPNTISQEWLDRHDNSPNLGTVNINPSTSDLNTSVRAQTEGGLVFDDPATGEKMLIARKAPPKSQLEAALEIQKQRQDEAKALGNRNLGGDYSTATQIVKNNTPYAPLATY